MYNFVNYSTPLSAGIFAVSVWINLANISNKNTMETNTTIFETIEAHLLSFFYCPLFWERKASILRIILHFLKSFCTSLPIIILANQNKNELFIIYRSRPFIKEAIMTEVILESTITCPKCGHQKTEVMPTNACQYFYKCEYCQTLLKPKAGDCCVFCSFGSVACPPIQKEAGCCASGR